MNPKKYTIAVVLGLGLCVTPAAARERVYYFHNDHLGTPQAMTDQSGRVVWQAEYDPFGKATLNQDPDGDGQQLINNLRFPGQYYDAETGLHYNWHRDYDPETGRYLQPDPIGLEGGLNLYGYVSNNPVYLTDPTGLLVVNNTDVSIWVKPGSTGEAIEVGPRATYAPPVDGVTYPNKGRGQSVYKVVDLYTNETYSTTINVYCGDVDLLGLDITNNIAGGGTKDQAWLKKRKDKKDNGWDAIFDAASRGKGCACEDE